MKEQPLQSYDKLLDWLNSFDKPASPELPKEAAPKSLGEYFYEICHSDKKDDFEPEFPRIQIAPRDVEA